MQKYKTTLLLLSLVIIDLFAFLIAFAAAVYSKLIINFVFPHIPKFHFTIGFLQKLWWMPLMFVFIIFYEKLYRKRQPFWEESKDILKVVLLFIILSYAIISIAKMGDEVSRLVVGILGIYLLFILPLIRFWGKKFLYNINLWKENVIIIGAGDVGVLAATSLIKEYYLGYNIIGFLDDDKDVTGKYIRIENKNYKIFGSVKHFRKFVYSLNISTIAVAIPFLSKEKLGEVIASIQKFIKNIIIIPDFKGIPLYNSELNYIFMQQLLLLNSRNNLKYTFNIFIKRLFDIIVSILLLPFILMAIGIIGLLIRLNSKGEIFYSHSRIGYNGKVIKVFKLRSMYQDADRRLKEILEKDDEAFQEWNKYFKLKNDPRVTKVGKFLRKSSLDELPQIFNVLRGDMSLVGPRPVLKKEIDEYYKKNAQYYYLVKPGITGLWQVSGRNDTDYSIRVNLDTWYIINWSLWLDVIILFKTIKVVLNNEGAY